MIQFTGWQKSVICYPVNLFMAYIYCTFGTANRFIKQKRFISDISFCYTYSKMY